MRNVRIGLVLTSMLLLDEEDDDGSVMYSIVVNSFCSATIATGVNDEVVNDDGPC